MCYPPTAHAFVSSFLSVLPLYCPKPPNLAAGAPQSPLRHSLPPYVPPDCSVLSHAPPCILISRRHRLDRPSAPPSRSTAGATSRSTAGATSRSTVSATVSIDRLRHLSIDRRRHRVLPPRPTADLKDQVFPTARRNLLFLIPHTGRGGCAPE
ncbi:hypothetical protein VPH35_005088 [Triticum aestivum]